MKVSLQLLPEQPAEELLAAARLCEAHHVIRTLLDEGLINFQGESLRYAGISTAARPVQEHVPLKLGAMGGPKSMQLAGEIADGLHTACAYSAEALRYPCITSTSAPTVPDAMPIGATSATRCLGSLAAAPACATDVTVRS